MNRKKLRTRKDVENENAELRGVVAELRKQVEELKTQAKAPALADFVRELQKIVPPQPQVIPYPQPLPWYPQPAIPIIPNPVYPYDWWRTYPYEPWYGTICGTTNIVANNPLSIANNACAAAPTFMDVQTITFSSDRTYS